MKPTLVVIGILFGVFLLWYYQKHKQLPWVKPPVSPEPDVASRFVRSPETL